MMRSRRAYALTRQETNSGAERIYGAEGFIFPPGRQLLAHAHTPNIWLFEVYSWGRLYVIVDSFVSIHPKGCTYLVGNYSMFAPLGCSFCIDTAPNRPHV